MCGETVADILNMVALVSLVLLVLSHAGIKKSEAGIISLAILGFLIIMNVNWYQTLFWESGASNYLYMTSWILLFLFPYMKSLETEDTFNPKLIVLWIIPLGLISGWSNENVGPTVFLETLAVIIMTKKKTGKIVIWQILGSVFCLIGCALCILAPGNFVRVIDAASTDASKSLLWRAFIRCYETTNGLLYYLAIPLVILALLAFVYIGVLKKKLPTTQIMFICMSIVSWGAMILSPHYPDRASFGSMTFMLIPIVYMLAGIIKESKIKPIYSMLLCTLIWLIGIFRPIAYICQQSGWIKK